MPEGFSIDYAQSLNGTMVPYSEQILISTDRSDWESRIEDEQEGAHGVLVGALKDLLGPRRTYGNVR